ncbi:MAG: DUF523 domain-containing protein [candidate division WOR-3 bacterium]
MPVLVSACLVGVHCRYDGSSRPDLAPRIPDNRILIPVCPEQLGGLPTPRPPALLCGGDGRDVLSGRASVLSQDGQDVTEKFMRGALETVGIAKKLCVQEAYLIEKSPSCGVNWVWTTSGLYPGMGVAAAALTAKGVRVIGLGEPD